MIGTQDRPCMEEQLLTASLTSHMGESHAADLIGALGMARSQLGSALLHLRSEWDRCDKPRKKTAGEIAVRSMALKDKKGKPDVRRATVEAIVEYARALRQRAAALSGRSAVVGLLTDFARQRGIDTELVGVTVFHFLAPNCGACDGHGKIRMEDSPALSNKTCVHCGGDGTWPRPLGAQALHDHMKSCLGQARTGAKRKMYG